MGHTGTLDPFATGLLVVMVGRATRLARFVEQQPKTYLATARLGLTTTTDDLTGEPVGEAVPVLLDGAAVEAGLRSLVGVHAQRPPAFSAKKVAGERSYRRARRGEAVELAPVQVTVHTAAMVRYAAPDVVFRVTVSAGTYVRALARDLGQRLGTAAHLTALRREAIGGLKVENAVAVETVSAGDMLPPLAVLAHLPTVLLDPDDLTAIRHGRAVRREAPVGAEVALVAEGGLVAVAREVDGWLRPAVVLEGE